MVIVRLFPLLFIALFLVVVIPLVAIYLLFRFLPWWGAIPCAIVILFFAKFLVKRALYAVFTAPFKMKGAVLRNAAVTVHSVTPCPPPIREAVKDADEEGKEINDTAGADPAENHVLVYFWVDATITPTALPGAFTLWEPGEIVLAPSDAEPEAIDDENSGAIEGLEIFEAGEFKPDQTWKYEGSQRVRMQFGVPPGETRFKFRYYFELFGELKVPAQ